jgi:hypothetical protein
MNWRSILSSANRLVKVAGSLDSFRGVSDTGGSGLISGFEGASFFLGGGEMGRVAVRGDVSVETLKGFTFFGGASDPVKTLDWDEVLDIGKKGLNDRLLVVWFVGFGGA